MAIIRPKTCRDGGCGQCDACHDDVTSYIECSVAAGHITEARAIELHAQNDAQYAAEEQPSQGQATAPHTSTEQGEA